MERYQANSGSVKAPGRGAVVKAGFHTRGKPNNGLQATAYSVRSVRREVAWKNVETPWVYRHPRSRWSEASQTTLWCEQHAPARPHERETSPQEVVAWLRNDMVHHLKRGKALRERLPLTSLV